MIRKPLELPPDVARAFADDMHAYFAEENPIKRDGIAVRQLRALREHQRPGEKKLRLSDVKGDICSDEGSHLLHGSQPSRPLTRPGRRGRVLCCVQGWV